jgi:ABC-2 type transport system permease protein
VSGFRAVLHRELRSYFLSPLSGAVGGIFLLLSGLLHWLNLREYMIANAQIAARFRLLKQEPHWLDFNEMLIPQDLGALAFLGLVFLPLIAMTLIAEERRSGTLELIMTSPIGETALVLGKWLAALLFFLFLLLLSLPALLLLAFYGPLHWPVLLLGLLGIVLMASAFLALALFLGTLTRSPLIAASSGFALMLLLALAEGFAQPGATGFPGGWLRAVSAMGHLEPMLRGLLDSSDILYFLIVLLLGLELSRRSLQALRLGGDR